MRPAAEPVLLTAQSPGVTITTITLREAEKQPKGVPRGQKNTKHESQSALSSPASSTEALTV